MTDPGKVLAPWPWPAAPPTVDREGATPSLSGRRVQIVPVGDGCHAHRVFIDGTELHNVRAVRIRMEALEIPIVELELIGASIAATIEGATLRDIEPCEPESSATE